MNLQPYIERIKKINISNIKMTLLTIIPRTFWTVTNRDGRAEFVIWRQWLGRAYDIASVVSEPGRYDRETDFGKLDTNPLRPRRPSDLSTKIATLRKEIQK